MSTREYAMTRPDHFNVVYAINPWMDPSKPVDAVRAAAQWRRIRDVYRDLGHLVHEIEAVPGLPDMMYAANAGFVVGGTAYLSRFAVRERTAEEPAYALWFRGAGLAVEALVSTNEGEGDFRVDGGRILAGWPFRTAQAAHAELAAATGLEVVSLELVDSRFYHLDTALAVLADGEIAYYPPAFGVESQQVLRDLYPNAVVGGADDAEVLGLNMTSDGHHVVMSDAAPRLADQLRERGYVPIAVDVSEIVRGGGGVKCCTLEIRR
jgi:ornithine--oxo-acid transaminase